MHTNEHYRHTTSCTLSDSSLSKGSKLTRSVTTGLYSETFGSLFSLDIQSERVEQKIKTMIQSIRQDRRSLPTKPTRILSNSEFRLATIKI